MTYEERQAACGLKVGDKVKILREWVEAMSNHFGEIGVITDFNEDSGVFVSFETHRLSPLGMGGGIVWSYPYFVLEKVEDVKQVTKPFTVEEFLTAMAEGANSIGVDTVYVMISTAQSRPIMWGDADRSISRKLRDVMRQTNTKFKLGGVFRDETLDDSTIHITARPDAGALFYSWRRSHFSSISIAKALDEVAKSTGVAEDYFKSLAYKSPSMVEGIAGAFYVRETDHTRVFDAVKKEVSESLKAAVGPENVRNIRFEQDIQNPLKYVCKYSYLLSSVRTSSTCLYHTDTAVFELRDGTRVGIPPLDGCVEDKHEIHDYPHVYVKEVKHPKDDDHLLIILTNEAHITVFHEKGRMFLHDWAQRLADEQARCISVTRCSIKCEVDNPWFQGVSE